MMSATILLKLVAGTFFALHSFYCLGLGQVLGEAWVWSPQTDWPEQGEPHEDASLSKTGQ